MVFWMCLFSYATVRTWDVHEVYHALHLMRFMCLLEALMSRHRHFFRVLISYFVSHSKVWFFLFAYCIENMLKISSVTSQLMRLWYLSHRRPAKTQASLRIRTVSPEPSLFAHMKYRSRRRVQPKIRHLAPLDDCACMFEEWVYGGRKVP